MRLTTKEAIQKYETLQRYDKKGEITTFRTNGNQRRYLKHKHVSGVGTHLNVWLNKNNSFV